jgi:hypothetical protein
VTTALDRLGYSYTDVTDRIGDLKNLMLAYQWDVVLISAEARRNIRGEYWAYVQEQIVHGATVIVETWLLDKDYGYSDANSSWQAAALNCKRTSWKLSHRGFNGLTTRIL